MQKKIKQREFSKTDINSQTTRSEMLALISQIAYFKSRLQEIPAGNVWIPKNWQTNKTSCVVQMAEHCTQVYFQPEQNAKETTLLPGVVLVDGSLMREIEQINAAKDVFKARMKFAKATLGRSPYLALVKEVVHPHSVSLLQLYRDFRIVYDTVVEVKFSWVFKETVNMNMSQEAAIKHIQEQIENPKIQQDLIAKLAGLGKVQFLYQRQIAPHLQANIKFKDAKPVAKKIHSPIFLIQDFFPKLPAGEVSIEPCSLAAKRAPRKDKKSWVQFYEGLNLFYA